MSSFSHHNVVDAANQILSNIRCQIIEDDPDNYHELNIDELTTLVAERLHLQRHNNLKQVINATGTVLHTNLGRAVLAREAAAAVFQIAQSYSNLELDLASGERGSRAGHIEELIMKLTGAEAAFAVNNNAAAILLVLDTLAKNQEVIVSRGELVEIGGSFRIPDVLARSGATMVEVGTTNKTHLKDYQSAIGSETAVLLKVHTSNYRILGFTTAVSTKELVTLGREHGLVVCEDLGSGVLLDLEPYGLPGEPTVSSVVAAGVDVVTFSGDKLLGGPQAGIIAGRRELITRIRHNQLARALRIDKLTLAALEVTLRLYLNEQEALQNIPTLQMLAVPIDRLEAKAFDFVARITPEIQDKALVNVVSEFSTVGGGAYPEAQLPTKAVAVIPFQLTVQELADRLRRHEPPILARLHQNRLLLDLRTILDEEIMTIIQALQNCLSE